MVIYEKLLTQHISGTETSISCCKSVTRVGLGLGLGLGLKLGFGLWLGLGVRLRARARDNVIF